MSVPLAGGFLYSTPGPLRERVPVLKGNVIDRIILTLRVIAGGPPTGATGWRRGTQAHQWPGVVERDRAGGGLEHGRAFDQK